MTEKTDGDCFKVAANIVALYDMPLATGDSEREAIKTLNVMGVSSDSLLLVHGLVMRPTDKLQHAHAWVEVPHMHLVVDYSNGHRAIVHKHMYYEAGEIEGEIQYNRIETRRAMVDYETYGPWHELTKGETDE